MLVRIWTTCVRRPRRVWMDNVHHDSHMEELVTPCEPLVGERRVCE